MIRMQQSALRKMLILGSTQEALEDTVVYLSEKLRGLLNPHESVLICFPGTDEKSLGALIGKAVIRCECEPVFWGDDLRWKELLRIAFLSRASTIIGPPLTILGLSKLAAYREVPLFVRNFVTSGYPCLDWMMDGIVGGLDCMPWGILSMKLKCVVAGFSCSCGRGIHLRDDLYAADIVDENGNSLGKGKWGRVVIYPKSDPDARVTVNAFGLLQEQTCACGSTSPKLVGMDYGNLSQASKFKIIEELLYWNSILDCHVVKSENGLEIEVVCLPGLKLPKFPNCDKLIVRTWEPDKDIPFEIALNWKKEQHIRNS